jgi:hypothetical protein
VSDDHRRTDLEGIEGFADESLELAEEALPLAAEILPDDHVPDCPSGSRFLGEDPACHCARTSPPRARHVTAESLRARLARAVHAAGREVDVNALDAIITELAANPRLFIAHLKPWEHGYEVYLVQVRGTNASLVGVTQTRGRTDREAEEMARDYLSLHLGVRPDAIDVVLIYGEWFE